MCEKHTLETRVSERHKPGFRVWQNERVSPGPGFSKTRVAIPSFGVLPMFRVCGLVWCRPNVQLRTKDIGRRWGQRPRRRARRLPDNDRRTGRYRRRGGPAKVWQWPGNLQRVHTGSSGKDLGLPHHPTEGNFRICGQFVHYSLGTGVSGTTSKALASRSLGSKLNRLWQWRRFQVTESYWRTRATRQNSFLIPPDWSL